ncbi:MAG: ABC transporter substrate-binding protein [Bifidobacteriaceae bacterium]|jgi:polar amino acid transport system substrate-binding protein|nr:ABC transporter substrate-binding protein [Bifidobacteriaceae bacterium]
MRQTTAKWLVPLTVAALAALAACGSPVKDQSSDAGSSPSGAAVEATDTTTDTATEATVDEGTETATEAALSFTPIEAGKLTVCTNPPYAPFEDVVGGEVVGFDLDLMAEVAKDLGLELSIREAPFESIESAASLESGDCDVGASALGITPERQAKMLFSEPYYESQMGILVAADSGIEGLADLAGKDIGVQQGTTGEDWAKERPEIADTLRQYENLGDQMTALKAGDVVGVINDTPTLTPYVEEGYKVLTGLEGVETEPFGFVIKLDNQPLVDAVNATLTRVKADGTYDQLLDKWELATS